MDNAKCKSYTHSLKGEVFGGKGEMGGIITKDNEFLNANG